MNVKYVLRIIANTMLIIAAFMIVPVIFALVDGQPRNAMAYIYTMGIVLVFSLALLLIAKGGSNVVYAQEGFAATALSWIAMSLFGALPFVFSGEIPNYVDALFEIVSGFTTTGSSILTDVEALSRCNIYWRSFSHWVGGMGVLVFVLAVVPRAKKQEGAGIHLMRAESPGPSVEKFTPHLRQTALILYVIYVLMTVVCFLFLFFGGMDWFDSICITFGTAGTGGFGIKNDSMGGYTTYQQAVVTVFMFLFGINFNLYFLLILKEFKVVFKSEELRYYFGFAAGAIALITINISSMFDNVGQALHHAAFQVSSIMTTTGYGTVDFEQWPAFSKAILLLLMFIGACAGSTAGGLKVSRVLLLGKSIKRTVGNALHPRRVSVVRMDGKPVSEAVTNNANGYLAVYFAILLASFAIISIDGYSIGTNFSAVAACFNNVGPGFEMVGATGNFSHYSHLSKLVLSADMLLGRLEIFPLLALFSPDLWSRKR